MTRTIHPQMLSEDEREALVFRVGVILSDSPEDSEQIEMMLRAARMRDTVENTGQVDAAELVLLQAGLQESRDELQYMIEDDPTYDWERRKIAGTKALLARIERLTTTNKLTSAERAALESVTISWFCQISDDLDGNVGYELTDELEQLMERMAFGIECKRAIDSGTVPDNLARLHDLLEDRAQTFREMLPTCSHLDDIEDNQAVIDGCEQLLHRLDESVVA